MRHRPYRVPLGNRIIIEDQIQGILRDGIIEPSTSPWASPITLVPKGDSWRFCVDYRKPNAVTKKDSYPLPLIQDIFDRLEGAAIFSTIDVKSEYWQIPWPSRIGPKQHLCVPPVECFSSEGSVSVWLMVQPFFSEPWIRFPGTNWKMLLCVHR